MSSQVVRISLALIAFCVILTGALNAAERDSDLIRRENAREGARDWQLTRVALQNANGVRAAYIEGYCSKQSASAGESIDIMVSTNPPSRFQIEIFRTGYYGGRGARHMMTLGPFDGQTQPDPAIGPKNLHECLWQPTAALTIPADWPSGVYLGRLTCLPPDETKAPWQSYVIFIVKDDRPADILFQCSDNTWNAYNQWPSNFSVYTHPKGNQGPWADVSFDRPYGRYAQFTSVVNDPLSIGAGEFISFEFPLSYFLEQHGYDVTYVSNSDMISPERGLKCKSFISVGHDEYWDRRQYNSVVNMRDSGVNLLFLSGNAVCWVTPLRAASDGRPARIMFRGGPYGGDYKYAVDREKVNGPFPERGPDEGYLIGARNVEPDNGGGDWIVTRPDHWIFAGTGMKAGDRIAGLVGWEYHGDPPPDIPGLEIVAAGTALVGGVRPQKWTATIYPGPKNNFVFNASTIFWAQGLGSPPGHTLPWSHWTRPHGPDERVQQITHNLLKRAAANAVAAQPAENADTSRHERVAARRAGVPVICHRGASEFAHENTLEAYRASLELGADGNEIDIRTTRDGVLVCFHDDMLDQLLDAFGDVADYDWLDLKTFAFRRPGPFGEFCRIPTLEEVFEFHRERAGLMHLDVKRPGLEPQISKLLDRLDLWDHVIAINDENAPALLKDARYKPLRYKGSLYADRLEVDPAAVKATLAKPGEMVIVDDPRGVLVGLGRTVGRVSNEPVANIRRPSKVNPHQPDRTEGEILKILLDDTDWASVPAAAEECDAKARSIRRRADAAEEIRRRQLQSRELEAALVRRVQKRSLHPEWMYDGLDGASALRALAGLCSPLFLPLARECLWRDDPAAAAVLDPRFKVPPSWTDFRTKVIVFDLVEQFPGEVGEAAEKLCRDYLLLPDDEARRIGPLQYEPAARALLLLRRDQATAVELLKHRRSDVRGRTILTCLAHTDAPWARAALEQQAPHALAYIPKGE